VVILRWMARRGAVGGTARFAAKGYNAFLGYNPTASFGTHDGDMKDLLRFITVARYAAMPSPASELLNVAILDGRIACLRDYVAEILALEAGMRENSFEHQLMFMEVIEQELLKAGVPRNVALGTSGQKAG